jgi:RNA polymerase sigma-70 factor (ECF subfamily)
MSDAKPRDKRSTPRSIFIRLNATDPEPRELAWHEFRGLYAPIIAGFARNIGVPAHDVDDIIQDVMLGFYSASPTFVYDPDKGRFRGYLKTATIRAVGKAAARHHLTILPPEVLDETSAKAQDTWESEWQRHLLDRALDQMRRKYKESRTWQIYEQYVLQNDAPEEVAARFGASLETVYQAKTRISEALKQG